MVFQKPNLVYYSRKDNGDQKRCDHRPCRPRQDHPGGSSLAGRRRAAPQRGGRGSRHGQRGSGAGAGHHHPLQEHRRQLRGRAHQHRGHPGPRRLRRRGGAHFADGGRGAAAGGRLRGVHAPDPVRAQEGFGARQGAGGGHQQGGPGRRPPRRGGGRDAGAVHRAGRHGRAAGLPHRLRLRPQRHVRLRSGPAGAQHEAHLRHHPEGHSRPRHGRHGPPADPLLHHRL